MWVVPEKSSSNYLHSTESVLVSIECQSLQTDNFSGKATLIEEQYERQVLTHMNVMTLKFLILTPHNLRV